MSVISRYRRRIGIGTLLTLPAVIFALVLVISTSGFTYARQQQVARSLPFAGQGQLTQISSDPFTNTTSNHKTEVEPGTFAFGNTIVSAFQQGRFFDGGGSDIGFATSQDGGRHWVHGSLDHTTVYSTHPGPYARASDASVAFDARHNVWIISYLGIVNPAGPVDVDVSRSTDGGLTWSAPVVVNASGDFNDKNWSTCDNSHSSPFYGHCYTEFDDFSQLNLFSISTSSDGGLTWGAATTNPDRTCEIGGQPVVQPNGTVIVPIDDCLEATVLSIRSTDGGKTWSSPVLAAQILNDNDRVDFGINLRNPPLISAGIDKSGRVYVTWSDCRFENFCGNGNNDLLLITSDDGVSWTLPKAIPIDPAGCTTTTCVDHFTPGLAVDSSTSGSSARLALVYNDIPNLLGSGTGCTNSTCQFDVGFISSTNGGKTWSAAQQLAGPMTLTWMPLTTQGYMVADYNSTVIVKGDDGNVIAAPVFQVAQAPTPPPNCSQLDGTPGQGCNQATFTDLMQIGGGNNVARSTLAPAKAGTRSGAENSSRLTAPGRSF